MNNNRRETDPMKEELIKIRAQLEDHLSHFETHEKEGHARHQTYVALQEANTRKIDEVVNNTASLVDAWGAAEGAIKFGSAVGRFARWIGSFAILGGLIHWASTHLHKLHS